MAYRDVILGETGLLSYWRLGETSGTNANDEFATNDGTYVGGYTLNQTGLVDDADPAVALNGSTGQVNLGLPTSVVNNWALECWLKLGSMSNQHGVLIFVGSDTGTGWGVQISDGSSGAGLKLGGYYANVADGWLDSGYTFANTDGHHVVMTRESGTTKWYVDGTQTGSTSAIVPGAPATLATIGSQHWFDGPPTYHYFFNGTIDEAAVYNAALSSTQALAHYNAGVGGTAAPSLFVTRSSLRLN